MDTAPAQDQGNSAPAGTPPAPNYNASIATARAAGYSDTEIASYLMKTTSLPIEAAKKADYNDTEILDHLSPSSARKAAQPQPAPDDGHWKAPEGGEFGDLTAQSNQTAGPQSQVGADINAVGQGLVAGTGSVIAGAGRAATAAGAQGTKQQLAVMDAIDQGQDVPSDQDVIGYQSLSPDQRAQARADFTAADTELDKREPNAAVRAGMALEGAAPSLFPIDPVNEGFQTGVGKMVGNALPALGASAVGSLVGGPVGGVLAGAAAIGSQAYDGTYQEAIAKGVSPEQAEDAAGKSAMGQIVAMSVPIAKVMPLIPVPLREGFVKTLVNLGQQGIEFGAGNALGTFANNYVASQTYDPTRPLTQGVTDAGLEGTVAGLVIRGGGAAFRAARDAAPAAAVEAIGRAPDVDSAIAEASKAASAPIETEPEPAPSFADLFAGKPADDAAAVAADGVAPEVAAGEAAPEGAPDAAPGVDPIDAAPAEGPPATSEFDIPTPPAQPVRLNKASIPKTAAEAKSIANDYYQLADRIGGTLTPEFANRLIDAVDQTAQQTPQGRAFAGDNAITALADRVQGQRDQPISLQGAQEIDEALGDLIDKEYGLKGLSKVGTNLLNLQTKFRDMIMNAGPDDTTNGTVGFSAIQQGRVAWSQAMKMMDLERILDRASQSDNPATAIKSGIRTLTTNASRMRGYTPEEVDALKDAGNRGVLGGVLHVFGSRLLTYVGGAAGLPGGLGSSLLAAGVAHAGTSAIRAGATRLQTGRAQDALETLGSRVPPRPDLSNVPEAAAPAAAAAPSPDPDLFNRPAEAVSQTQIQREQAAIAAMRARADAERVGPDQGNLLDQRAPAQEAVKDQGGPNRSNLDQTGPAATPERTGGADLYQSKTALTPSGNPVPVRYVVREASDLTPSQLPDGRANPAFPQALQPRDRSRAASLAQVTGMANRLQPELLGYSGDTSTGAPVIGPDGVVESGNGRTMAIQRAYAQNGPQAAAYRQWLANQGFDVDGMRQPVLVRERTEPMDMDARAKLADEMGASPTMAMSASERAAADAKRIPTDTLSLYQGGDVTSPRNAAFVRAFADHAIPASEHASFMTADGELSTEGAARMRNALTQRAYGDNALVTALAENADPEIKAFGGALMDAAGPMARLRGEIEQGKVSPEEDIAPGLVEAANIIQTARRQRISLADAVGQVDAFTPRDARAEQILQAMFGDDFKGRMSRPKMTHLLTDFADKLRDQSGLFGDGKNANVIFDEAAKEHGYGSKRTP